MSGYVLPSTAYIRSDEKTLGRTNNKDHTRSQVRKGGLGNSADVVIYSLRMAIGL
jgi:hypothetical protein